MRRWWSHHRGGSRYSPIFWTLGNLISLLDGNLIVVMNLSTLSTMSMLEERMYPPVRIIIKTLQATFPACHWNIFHHILPWTTWPPPQLRSSSWFPWAWWWRRWQCQQWWGGTPSSEHLFGFAVPAWEVILQTKTDLGRAVQILTTILCWWEAEH